MAQVICRRPAMATLFEFLLVGDDEEHLAAVGEAALDEVTRIEQMISMHDPTSELARVNREAYQRPTLVSWELLQILQRCHWHHNRTLDWYDPCHGCPVPYGKAVVLDEESLMVRFTHPVTRIDLGGYGKGYALDLAQQVVNRFHVDEYLLHGGTSSVLACGEREWPIGLRSPDGNRVLGHIQLQYQSLSCSSNGTYGSVVIAECGEIAEKWSTAILAAGRERASDFNYDDINAAAWLDSDIHWFVDHRL